MSTWVLLRGLTREQAHWGRFPAQLAQALPDAHVLTIDLPGAGNQRHLRCPLRVESIAQSCRRQLQAAQIAPPYHLLGLSLGGMVAAAWATSLAEEVSGCVLVNTSMRPFSALQDRLRLRTLPVLLGMLASRDPWRIERAVLRLTSRTVQPDAGLIDEWVAVRQLRPVDAANALRQLLAAARYRHPGSPPAMPVLVACSDNDALVNPRCSRALAERWSAELVSHPDAGHDLPLDAGPWLAGQIANWSHRVCCHATVSKTA
jgi:pimeloyl-ACP methyl ester carboxylesterase